MTKRRMYFKMITSSLMRRRSRMVVALLAIAIGSTVLSGLLTVYYDIPRQLGTVFRSYGANMILLPAQSEEKIDQHQINLIKSFIPKDRLVGLAPYVYVSAKINEQPYLIAGTELEEAKKNAPYWLIHGRWPKKEKEVLIGNEIARMINLSVGSNFVLNTPKSDGEYTVTQCTVSGIVTTGGAEEQFIFMSVDDVRQILKKNIRFDVIECSIDASQAELEQIAQTIEQHDKSVFPRLVKRVTESQDIVLNKLQALVWIVTIIVLFLTMICVSTTMMAVVTERRREIGLKKALGASNASVVQDFIGEAILLGILGGILGVILGYFFADAVSVSVFTRNVSFPFRLVPVTILVSVLITIVACLIPVRGTVDIDPALVLRGE